MQRNKFSTNERHHVKYGMEWNRGMELWNGMELVFRMEFGMFILSYTFDVKVTNAISLDERGHSHDNTCIILTVNISASVITRNFDKIARIFSENRIVMRSLIVIRNFHRQQLFRVRTQLFSKKIESAA